MIKYQHLLGRKFIHGQQDCFQLARDFYWDNFGITLINYARPDKWWEHGFDLYKDYLYAQGFQIVQPHPTEWRIGDGFLISIRTPRCAHAAIYIGGGYILHHFYGRRSEVTPYKGMWRNNTRAMVRHKDVPDLMNAAEHKDALDALPGRKRKELKDALG